MSISYEQILMVIGGASTITTAIFWGSYQLGRFNSRLERVEQRLTDIDYALRRSKVIAGGSDLQ